LGADQVIDYTREDFTQNGETYDLIFDTVAGKTSFYVVKSLKPKSSGSRRRARDGPNADFDERRQESNRRGAA
jgi:NADPH:quinone reductase-like Zn-dependent oxidoreductase